MSAFANEVQVQNQLKAITEIQSEIDKIQLQVFISQYCLLHSRVPRLEVYKHVRLQLHQLDRLLNQSERMIHSTLSQILAFKHFEK